MTITPKHIAVAALALLLGATLGGPRLSAQDEPAPAETFASSSLGTTEIENALATAHIDNFRAVGTSSITFQLQLTGPIDGAFKPETANQRRGWLNEVAAYRIARYLGMDNVPPVIVRVIDRGQFLRRLDPEYEGDWDVLIARIVFVSGAVRGSVSYWIPNLGRGAPSDLDAPAGMLRWTSWLDIGSEVPEDSRLLARDLSEMTVFDLLIGNADRTSGGNMRGVVNDATRLVVRDHNLAFSPRPSAASFERMVSMLRRAHRFPRAFVERLSALDEATLRAITADEAVGPLLDDAQVAGVLSRRDTALSWIGALIEAHGEAAVLSLE